MRVPWLLPLLAFFLGSTNLALPRQKLGGLKPRYYQEWLQLLRRSNLENRPDTIQKD